MFKYGRKDNTDLKYKHLKPTLTSSYNPSTCLGCGNSIQQYEDYFSWYNNMFRNTRQEICLCVNCLEDMKKQLEDY